MPVVRNQHRLAGVLIHGIKLILDLFQCAGGLLTGRQQLVHHLTDHGDLVLSVILLQRLGEIIFGQLLQIVFQKMQSGDKTSAQCAEKQQRDEQPAQQAVQDHQKQGILAALIIFPGRGCFQDGCRLLIDILQGAEDSELLVGKFMRKILLFPEEGIVDRLRYCPRDDIDQTSIIQEQIFIPVRKQTVGILGPDHPAVDIAAGWAMAGHRCNGH